MIALAALTGPLPKAGVILVAAFAGVALLSTTPRSRAAGIAGSLVLAPILLLADIWHSPQLAVVHRHPLVAAVGGAVAVAALIAVAAVISRRRWLIGPLAVIALPFRVPISAGGTTSNLLVPLYAVVAAGSLALIWDGLRGDGPARPSGDGAPAWDFGRPQAPRAGTVERLLALAIGLYAVQATYSAGFEKALQQVVFFYVPFALLFVLLAGIEWTPKLVRTCFQLVFGLAVLFAGIGFVEYATRTILLNPKLIAANDVHAYFTVNSVFFDPDIFGRFLALVMIGLAVGLVYERTEGSGDAKRIAGLGAGLAALWGGLVLTLSRSSLAALLVGVAVLASFRFQVRKILLVAAAVVAAGGVAVAIAPKTFGLNQGLNGASSGRADLVSGGFSMFGDRPVWGYGAGSFVAEYRKRHPGSSTTLSASHTIPITIAAEQGVIGELVYIALLISTLLRLFGGARADPVRAGVAAAFLALLFHTMLYADFLEDPVAWVLMAVGSKLAAQAVPARRRRRAPAAGIDPAGAAAVASA
jgi:putative inorganic carbon (HCO3(-)) transporter